jgi:hypothetical protein
MSSALPDPAPPLHDGGDLPPHLTGVRWANNMQHAEVSENRQLTWHYVSRDCLPAVVLEALARQQQPQAPQP